MYIGANAILIGEIVIGNNSKIRAGAIVVENVPSNSTVVVPKATIVVHKDIYNSGGYGYGEAKNE